jgi:hypothetical protein
LDIIQQIELLAEKLGDLCEEVVVVGACSPALILDVSTAPDLRPTGDVDIVVQADNYGRYFSFVEKIKKKGICQCDLPGTTKRKIHQNGNTSLFRCYQVRGIY